MCCDALFCAVSLVCGLTQQNVSLNTRSYTLYLKKKFWTLILSQITHFLNHYLERCLLFSLVCNQFTLKQHNLYERLTFSTVSCACSGSM